MFGGTAIAAKTSTELSESAQAPKSPRRLHQPTMALCGQIGQAVDLLSMIKENSPSKQFNPLSIASQKAAMQTSAANLGTFRAKSSMQPVVRRGAATIRASASVLCRSAPTPARSHILKRSSPGFSGKSLSLPSPVSAHTARRSTRSRAAAVTVEANLFSRAFRVVQAFINQTLGGFEDPEKLLDRLMDEMTQDAGRMRQASAQAMAAQRQMTTRTANAQAAADQWLRRAELAVSRGQDELAREALTRRKALQADADKMAAQAKMQQQACDQLSASVRMLESKISEARSKKETLKARAASAKTSIAIQEMIGSLRSTSSSSFAVFDKMEEKVMALEAEAQSAAALATPDALEARFAMLEGGGGVEDELQALKSGLLKQEVARPRVEDYISQQQPAPVAVVARNDVDYELEQLRQMLSKGQLKHDSGLTKAKQDTARWSAAIQPQLQQLAAATPAGTTLDSLQAHILALKATWDALWEEYLKPRWRRQRLGLHHAQERVIEAFCKKVVNGMKWVSRHYYHQERGVAVFLGAGNFSQGGWKAGAARAGFRKVVEQPSRPGTDPRPDRLVIVDEFRTSRVSSSVHARQPCELHLPPNQPRPADWVPPAGQVNPRLVRPACSLRHGKYVRGLSWCHQVPPNPPPPPPHQDPLAPAQPPAQDPPPTPAQAPPPTPAQAP
ncbi:hypothetical protein QJQ45_013554, partial [Haematococcus lacustris]